MIKPILTFASGFLLLLSTVYAHADYTPPKMLEDANTSEAKSGPGYGRLEGWATLYFMVSKEGGTEQVLIETSDPKYQSSAQSYLNLIKYAPAKVGDKLAYGQSYTPVDFTTAYFGNPNNGISPPYAKMYDQVFPMLLKGEIENGEPLLQELLEDHTKNLTEQALSAWLKSIYYFHKKDWGNYGNNLKLAARLRYRLPPDLAYKSTDNLMKFQINKKHFADALQTFLTIDSIKGKELAETSIKEVIAAVWDLINKHPKVESEETLIANRIWTRKIHRRQIAFQMTEGKADRAALYCQNGFHEFAQATASEYSIPEAFGKCTLMLKSEQSATFSFSEQGELIYTSAANLVADD